MKTIMEIAFFSTKSYDQVFFERANKDYPFDLKFFKEPLTKETAYLATGSFAVCAFVNDDLCKSTLEELKKLNIKTIALRCTGFNNLDLKAAFEMEFKVVNVPHYSPHAVAEHAVALMLALNRKIPKAYIRSKEGNFSLDSLLGFDMNEKIVGVIGSGSIGKVLVKILLGFECKVLCYDPKPDQSLNVSYTSLENIFKEADIISLHCPLNPNTYHLINETSIKMMKDHVMIINTGRGGLIDTKAVIEGLKNEKIGYLGIDVYEEEANLFFEDKSDRVLLDDLLVRLLMMPNVIVTSHMGFFTDKAMNTIAQTTLLNLYDLKTKNRSNNMVIFCEC